MKLAHFLGFGLAALLAGNALADITPTLTGTTTSGSDTIYAYTLSLDNTEQLVANNNEFCISDVGGFVTATLGTPINWSISEDTTGCPIPAGTSGYPNTGESVIIKYTGATTIDGPDATLTTFTITSTIAASNVGTLAYGAAAESNGTNTPVGTATQNQGEVAGPSAVPEPVTTSIVGGALALMALVARRRSAKKA